MISQPVDRSGRKMGIKVLIVVPVYNVEQYINKFIDSILNQSFKSWEMVLVDDGSTDGSGLLCDGFASKNAAIHVIHQANKGISAARNAGLESGRDSDYVIFVDPDDWLDPNMLEEMVKNSDGADLVVCDTVDYYKYDEEETIKPRNTWGEVFSPFAADGYYDVLCKTGTIHNKMIKRDAIGSVRFDEKLTYGEDCVFLCKILSNVKRSIVIPKPLYYYYRNRQGSVVSSQLGERTMEFLRNSSIIYEEMVRQGHPSCGVCRVRLSVYEVFNKISSVKKGRKYLSACGSALRKTSLSDRLRYVRDKHFQLSFRGAVLFFILCYFPVLWFKMIKKEGYI